MSFARPNFYLFVFIFFLVLMFGIRVYNLNYNSPFNDEAVYIVVGKLGLFQRDFWSYNASSWMAGHPFFYPSMSALAYVNGGILGSRMLSVIFGVLAVEIIFHITKRLATGSEGFQNLAGLMAATTLGISSVAIYISRLATYDMSSYYFLLLSILSLLIADKDKSRAKWYFLSAVFLLLAVFIKIIVALFVPLIFLYALYQAKKGGKEALLNWRVYFLVPLSLGFGFYLLIGLSSIKTYLTVQLSREQFSVWEIISFFWKNSGPVVLLGGLGSLGMLLTRQWKKWLVLTLLACLILVVHLVTRRLASFDKHIFLSVMFLSIISGLGISSLAAKVLKKFKSAKYLLAGTLLSIFMIFGSLSYSSAQEFNFLWADATPVLKFLNEKVKPRDKVLAQSGASVILTTYNKNFPLNITTFDFFTYNKLGGEAAYREAVRDGYFNLIELENDQISKQNETLEMKKLVQQNMENSYKLIFEDKGFSVYQRSY